MNYVIALSGASGSGKSTLTRALAQELEAVSLFFDSYQSTTVFPPDMMARLAQGQFVDPKEITSPLFAQDLKRLKEGRKVTDPNDRGLEPTRFIVVEEPFARLREGMNELIDFVIFIDIPLDVALARRLLRDLQFENADIEPIKKLRIVDSYLKAYLGGLRNGYRQVITEIHNSADLVLDGLEETAVNVEKIVNRVTLP